jgi:hypothetical protein
MPRRIFRSLPPDSATGDHWVMPTTTRLQRRYDHRLRDLVQTTGELELAIRHGVPRSTARGWRTKTTTEGVSLDVLELNTIRLRHEVIRLRRRIARLVSLLRLVVIVVKVSGISFARIRLPEGTAKLQLLRAIERSRAHLPLRTVLRLIDLSHARYHDWIRNDWCGLDDRPSCPRSPPQQPTRVLLGACLSTYAGTATKRTSAGVLIDVSLYLAMTYFPESLSPSNQPNQPRAKIPNVECGRKA